MAAPETCEQFLELVRKANLIGAKKLDEFLSNSHTPLGSTAKDIANLLVRDGLLTGFQTEQLLNGKYRGFDLGKYRLLERVGHGGMGQVYLAEHMVMRRPVALKILPPKQARCANARERFMREARAAGALSHPNIVRAYDVDSAKGVLFLVMEFVDGCSLQQLVSARGPLAPERAAYYLWQAAIGLQHAHEAGLVHRDIKPANLLLDRTGVVKLLDLGLARFFADSDDHLTQHDKGTSILGTADFLAPEQAIDSHEVDIRADIYSLGATAYYLLTGKPPFADGTTAQKLLAHQMKDPQSIRSLRPGVAEELSTIIHKMMRKNAADRYQSPAEVIQALDRWTADPPPAPSPEEMPARCRALSGPISSVDSSATALKSAARTGLHSAGHPSHWHRKPQPRWIMPLTITAGAAFCTFVGAWSVGWLNGATPRGTSDQITPAVKVVDASANAIVREPAAPPVTPAVQKATAVQPAQFPRDNRLVVDRSGSDNSFVTLSAAIAAAKPGNTIVVRDTELRESVRVGGTAQLTIVGEAPHGGRVHWLPPGDHTSSRPLVAIHGADDLRLAGFAFDGEGRVDVLVSVSGSNANLVFDDVHLTQFKKHGIKVVGGDGTTVLRRCRIFEGGKDSEAAVRLQTGASSTRRLEATDCRFEGPSSNGILAFGPAADLAVTHCRFNKLTSGIRWDAGKDAGAAPFALAARSNTFGEMYVAISFATTPDPSHPGTKMELHDNLFAASSRTLILNDQPNLAPNTSARMIWCGDTPNPYEDAPVGRRYFRKQFSLSEVPSRATLDYMADGQCTVWINDHELPRASCSMATKHIACAEVGSFLRTGDNHIAVMAENTPTTTASGKNGAWLIARLAWRDSGGANRELTTDASWRCGTNERAGWNSLGFDDSSWTMAKELLSSQRAKLPPAFVWDSQVQLLGDLPQRLFGTASGNIRHMTKVHQCPWLPKAETASRIEIGTDPADDATFLRYPASIPSLNNRRPGVTPPGPRP